LGWVERREDSINIPPLSMEPHIRELIPDTVAYDQVLFHLASTKFDIGLTAPDREKLRVLGAEFLSQRQAWVERWNAKAEVDGERFDPTPFLKQQEEMVSGVRQSLAKSVKRKLHKQR